MFIKKTKLEKLIFTTICVSYMTAEASGFISEETGVLARTHPILAVDGGGVRGIVAATVLSELENKLSSNLVDYFDVMAGTSTGALIVLPLNLTLDEESYRPRPLYNASDLVQCYEEFAPRIFNSDMARPYSSLGGWWGPYYSSDGLEIVAREFFGERTLKHTIKNVIIPGVEIERDKPILFSSLNANMRKKDDFLMRDVAVAAGAAPTYFAPKKLFNMEGTAYSVIDGGIMANNPSFVAYAHAEAIYGKEAHDTLLISLGTGQVRKPLQHEQMARKGKLGWAQNLISLMLRSQSTYVHTMMDQILTPKWSPNQRSKRYYRLQGNIDFEQESLDDASLENLRRLKITGERFVEEFSEDLEEISSRLEAIKEAKDTSEDDDYNQLKRRNI